MPSDQSNAIRQHIQKEVAASDLSLTDQRNAWIEHAKTLPLRPDIVLSEEEIAGVRCLWLSRADSPKGSTIVYLHGGGYVDGSILTHREFVSRLVAITGHRALMVEYRLAPEHRFPAALDDVINVYSAVCSSGRLDPAGTALGGDSSGGGLTLSTMMQLAREKKKLPACAFTISGVFDMTLSGETMDSRNKVDPCLSYEALKAWTSYFDGQDLSSPDISPLFGEACGLPPVLLQVGDHEVWLDDSRRMALSLIECGGTADLRIWDSMWHVWPMYPDLPEAREAIEEIGEFIDRYLPKRFIKLHLNPEIR